VRVLDLFQDLILLFHNRKELGVELRVPGAHNFQRYLQAIGPSLSAMHDAD
jgi:hypothetical protein